MSHHHSHHGHSHGHQTHHHDSMANLKMAFWFNFSFTIIEIIGGLFTNSMAILSDALHDLGDSLAIGMSWYFEKISDKKKDHNFSYGYGRFSLLAALISSIILLVGSVFIIYETIPRLINPQPVHVEGVFVLAIIGVLVNGAAVFRLRKGDTANEKVVRLHLLEDVLGWVAVLIGSILMYLFGWMILDPILSIGIALFILWNVFKNLREFIKIILQGVPTDLHLDNFTDRIGQMEHVINVHDVHIWSLDGKYHILSVHVVVEDDTTADDIITMKNEVRKQIREMGILHETLEFEYKRETCDLVDC